MIGRTITALANDIPLFQVFVKNSIQVFQVLKWFSSTYLITKHQFKYNEIFQVFQVTAGHLELYHCNEKLNHFLIHTLRYLLPTTLNFTSLESLLLWLALQKVFCYFTFYVRERRDHYQ